MASDSENTSIVDNADIMECNKRKRKATPISCDKENKLMNDSMESEHSTPGVKWAVNRDTMIEILTDMGVALLDDNSSSSDYVENNERTPNKCLKQMHTNANGTDVYEVKNESSPKRNSYGGFLKKNKIKINHSSNISDEVILHIFKWLPKCVLVLCAQTCRRWRRLAFDESLWKRLDVGRRQLNPGDLGRIVHRGVQALRVAAAEVSDPIYKEIEDGTFVSKLKYLDLSMAAISVAGLGSIISVCVHLRKLSIENCKLDNSVCQEITKNHHLQVLNMSLCQGLTFAGLEKITKKCKSLTELNVGWTDINPEALTMLLQNLPPAIRRLGLSGMRSKLSDEGIEDLTISCPDIMDLDISDCLNLTSVSMELIISRLVLLKCLCVNRCYTIPLNEYLKLKYIKTLKKLEIYGILSQESLVTLNNALPNVEVNKTLFSTIARPTTGVSRSSIWGIKVRD